MVFFLVRGIARIPYAEERITRLQQGERLLWLLDRQNEFDPSAMALRTTDHVFVGYVPAYLAEELQVAAEKGAIEVVVEKVNRPPAPVHHRVLCRMSVAWPRGHRPFSSNRFLPMSVAVDGPGDVPSPAP